MIGILNIETAQTDRLTAMLDDLEVETRLVDCGADVERAARLIVPHCTSTRAALRDIRDSGLIAPLIRACDSGRPVLAVSSGLHLLMDVIHDEGVHTGLGVLSGKASVFDFGDHPAARHFVLPHQGWNQVQWEQGGPLLAGLSSGEYFFFDHSICAEPLASEQVTAKCNHGIDFAAVLTVSNIFATQFLPEKSEDVGARVLRNFLNM